MPGACRQEGVAKIKYGMAARETVHRITKPLRNGVLTAGSIAVRVLQRGGAANMLQKSGTGQYSELLNKHAGMECLDAEGFTLS